MKDLYIIKDRLNEALKYRDMTPKQLADKSGLHFTAIYRYLRGDRIPKTDTIDLMAKALNVSPAWILGYEVPMLPTDPDLIVKTEEDTLVLELHRKIDTLSDEDKKKALDILNYIIAKGKEVSDNGNSEV